MKNGKPGCTVVEKRNAPGVPLAPERDETAVALGGGPDGSGNSQRVCRFLGKHLQNAGGSPDTRSGSGSTAQGEATAESRVFQGTVATFSFAATTVCCVISWIAILRVGEVDGEGRCGGAGYGATRDKMDLDKNRRGWL